MGAWLMSGDSAGVADPKYFTKEIAPLAQSIFAELPVDTESWSKEAILEAIETMHETGRLDLTLAKQINKLLMKMKAGTASRPEIEKERDMLINPEFHRQFFPKETEISKQYWELGRRLSTYLEHHYQG